MPKYDYRCELNWQTVEVSHAMNDVIKTWCELCAHVGIVAGETPVNCPVHKIISGGFVATGASSEGASHSCAAPACRRGGMCDLDI